MPPFIYGPDFKCQNFQFTKHQYFHVHGGIEFDITTPAIEDALEVFQVRTLVIPEMVWLSRPVLRSESLCWSRHLAALKMILFPSHSFSQAVWDTYELSANCA